MVRAFSGDMGEPGSTPCSKLGRAGIEPGSPTPNYWDGMLSLFFFVKNFARSLFCPDVELNQYQNLFPSPPHKPEFLLSGEPSYS